MSVQLHQCINYSLPVCYPILPSSICTHTFKWDETHVGHDVTLIHIHMQTKLALTEGVSKEVIIRFRSLLIFGRVLEEISSTIEYNLSSYNQSHQLPSSTSCCFFTWWSNLSFFVSPFIDVFFQVLILSLCHFWGHLRDHGQELDLRWVTPINHSERRTTHTDLSRLDNRLLFS